MKIAAFVVGCAGWVCIMQVLPHTWEAAGWTFAAATLFAIEESLKS